MRHHFSPYLKAGLLLAFLATVFGTIFFDTSAEELPTKGFFCGTGMANQLPLPPPPKPVIDEDFKIIKQVPLFPGCEGISDYVERKACADNKLLEFVYGNITYPPEAIAEGVEGTAVITFVVEKDGRVSGAKIRRDPGAGTGAEALRVVKLINEKGLRFDPVSSRGRSVRVQFNLPVKFKLE